jgi:hypothetical protein
MPPGSRPISAATARKTGWGLAAALLLAAGIGTATGQMNWGPGDFVVAALLFGLTGLGLEGAASLPQRLRPVAGMAVIAALLLIWAELAVGIFH